MTERRAAWPPAVLLRDASYAVATDPRDIRRFRENHLEMLRSFVLGKRGEAAARAREQQEREFDSADCADCHGVGTIRVPQPRFVVDLILQRPVFIAVACRCQVGNARFNAINSQLMQMQAEHRLASIDEYEALCPDWRPVLKAHGEERRRTHAVADVARRADRSAPIDIAATAERLSAK